MSKYRNWCFTLNNYTNEEALLLLQQEKFKYIIFGYEIGENGTKHLQGYFELRNPCGIKTVKKINNRMHLENRKGTQEQAINYCIKNNNIVAYNGEKSNDNGVRKDWQTINSLLVEHKSIPKMIELGFGSYQNIKHMETIYKYLIKPRNFKTEVYWIFGPSGCGKSRYVHENFTDIYWKNNSKWWDGYCGQEVVCIDDYRIDFCSFNELLNLMDRYPKKVEIKGAMMEFTSKKLIITTPYGPTETWFGHTKENLNQLLRRIDILVDLEQAILGNTILE